VETAEEHWAIEEQLGPLARAATGSPRASVILAEMPPTIEGYIQITNGDPDLVISRALPPVGKEAAVLHEAGHWREGHEADLAEAYAAARARGLDDPEFVRLEQNADRHALRLLGEVDVRQALTSDVAAVAAEIKRDAAQYGTFEEH
jgi:hypothetical protein